MNFTTAMRSLLDHRDSVLPCLVNAYKANGDIICHWNLTSGDSLRLQIERIVVEAKMILPDYFEHSVQTEFIPRSVRLPSVLNITFDV